MLVKKCDRCGSIFSMNDSEHMPIREHPVFNSMAVGIRGYSALGNSGYTTSDSTEQFDLCPRCQKSLIDWLEVIR